MSRFPRPGRTPRPRPVPTAGPTPTPSPTPGPGTTFTLTTNIETVPASGVLPANSTVTGVITGTTGTSAAGSTYQTGDIINANQTSDVKITVATAGVPSQVVAINNARSVQFRNVAGAPAQSVNAALFSGVTEVGSFGSLGDSDITITNGDIASRYVLSNPTAQSTGAVADLSVGFINATGTSDVAKFAVENVGFASTTAGVTTVTNAALTVNGNTAESASIATAGTNFIRPTIGTAATSLAFTGSGNNSVTLLAGDLTNNAKTVSFATATGANALELGSFVRAGDTYTGGSGLDVLGIAPAGLGATALNVSGFETLALQSGTTSGILGFATAPNFQRVNVLQSSTAGTITLSNAGTIPALNFVGTGTAAAQNFNGVVAATTGTVNVAFANGAATATGYETGNVTLNGANTINVAIAGTSTSQNNLDGDTFASTSLVTFSASGTGIIGSTNALTVNGSGGTAQNLQSINLSGLTGTGVSKVATTNGSFAALSVTASPGGATFTPGQEASGDVVTFTGGNGADTLRADTNSYFGLVNFTGGAGTDTVIGNNNTGSGTSAPGGIIFAQGGSGADTLTGGSAADTLQGDADNDVISGKVGLDVVSGGTGQDTFQYQESLTTDVDTITDFAFGASADNIAYTGGSGFVFGNATATVLNNLGGGVVGTSGVTVLATFGGGGSAAPSTNANFVQLTSTNSTSFAGAIGANGIAVAGTAVFAATDSIAASYFDSTNQQAVFGFITNTTLDGFLNSSDTFTEVARAATTSTAYTSLVASNVTFF